MKPRLSALLLVSLLLAAGVSHAKPAPKVPDDRPVLALVVVDSLLYQQGAITDYDRLDLAFTALA